MRHCHSSRHHFLPFHVPFQLRSVFRSVSVSFLSLAVCVGVVGVNYLIRVRQFVRTSLGGGVVFGEGCVESQGIGIITKLSGLEQEGIEIERMSEKAVCCGLPAFCVLLEKRESVCVCVLTYCFTTLCLPCFSSSGAKCCKLCVWTCGRLLCLGFISWPFLGRPVPFRDDYGLT